MTIWIDAEAFAEALNRSSVWGWSTEQDETAHKWVFGEIEKFLNDNQQPDGDTISRRALMKRISEEYHKYGDEYDALQILGDIEDFPPAPNTNQHVQSVGCVDLISRQDAIEAIEKNAYRHTYIDQIIDIINSLPSAPDSRQRETNKEIAERIINNTCKNRVFCELYPDACQKEKCDIYLVINTFLNTPDTDTPSRQRGEWVRNNKIGTFKIFTCDKCGCNMDTDAWDFCPNCGAYMGGQYDGQKR